MAKTSKFSTFGGVFTPSILTILGVIMYLRLPRVVGSAGLYATLGIILVAHVISIATGLSISSIATDKRVGAGGPYYVLSRSLGLPLGGTIGLALFIGLSFSVSLYVIGFSESLLNYLGVEQTPLWIRVTGTATVVLLTIITFVSTSLAIKTQYLILALIALSLVSVFLGTPAKVEGPLLEQEPGGPPLALLFGIFFPAVTGFTAGVNMSGDLKDPKKSIPSGTILAIATGLIVYVALAVFLAFRVDPKQLREDPELLLSIAWAPPLVVAGIWGATLSSALGSILGAPRILQSMSSDRVTPTLFAKGYGPTNEPRNALVLAFLVGEAGILIAELDLIARVVSMVFLAMYGFVNVACAIESWSSPDFRPTFRIPTWVSVVGAVTCLIVMIQLDLLAMAGSLLLMLGLYAFLQRRRLSLDSGDAWEGVWSAVVRAGLRRLSRATPKAANWKPNILSFCSDDTSQADVRPIAIALVANAGVATEFHLGGLGASAQRESLPAPSDPEPAAERQRAPGTEDDQRAEDPSDEELPPGFFRREATGGDPMQTIATLASHYGFSGIRPNTVLLPLSMQGGDPAAFEQLIHSLEHTPHNLLLAQNARESHPGELRIDVWWTEKAGNFAFSVALVRFLSRSSRFRNAAIRFLLLTRESASDDVLAMEARQHLRQARVSAEVRVFQQPAAMRHPMDVVVEESREAGLVIAALPKPIEEEREDEIAQACRRIATLDAHLLLYRASKRFREVLRATDRSLVGSLIPRPRHVSEQPLLDLVAPDNPTLADAVVAFDARAQEVFSGTHGRTITRVYRDNQELVEQVLQAVRTLRAAADTALADNGGRPRDELRQALSEFRAKVSEALVAFEEKTLEEQRALLDSDVSTLSKPEPWLTDAQQPVVVIHRRISDYELDTDDAPAVRRLKRKARWRARLGRRTYSYRLPLGNLERYYHKHIAQRLTSEEITNFLDDSLQLTLELSKALNRPLRELSLARSLYGADGEAEGTLEFLGELERVCGALRLRQKLRRDEYHAARAQLGRATAQEFALDIQRLDAAAFIREKRTLTAKEVPDPGPMLDRIGAWKQSQATLLQLTNLGQRLAALLHEISVYAFRTRDEVLLGSGAACLHDCERLASQLRRAVSGRGTSPEAFERFVGRAMPLWEPQTVVERLSADLQRALADVPKVVSAVAEDTLLAMMAGQSGDADEAEPFELHLRRGLDVVLSREFLGPLSQRLRTVKSAQRSAWSVVDDVAQLMTFQLNNSPDGVTGLAERSLSRVTQQREAVTAAQDAVRDLIARALEQVAGAANVNQLEKLQDQLQGDDLYNRARAAEQGAKSILFRVRSALTQAATDLLYRRSRGLVTTLKGGTTRRTSASVELRALVEESQPGAAVREQLPHFYRQLFSGQAAVGGSFQVEREGQQKVLEECVRRRKRGTPGPILIVGDPGSGKTTLIQELLVRLAPTQIFRVQPPDGGTASLKRFRRAVGTGAGAPSGVFDDLPDGSAIVVDDLEMWWERREGGLAVVEYLIESAREHGHRLSFVISTGSYSFHLLDRLLPLSTAASGIAMCEPFSAEELRQAVLRRHQSTGLKFELGSRSEEEVGAWSIARLFTRYFDYSAGNIAAAFGAWLSHIHTTDGESIQIRAPRTKSWEALDEIDGDAKSLLLQLILHKSASRERLQRIFGREHSEIDRVVRELLGASILTDLGSGTVTINEAIRHHVSTHFLKRGLL